MTGRNTRARIFCFFACCCALFLELLSPQACAQQLPLRYYTTTEGLGNLAVTALAQETDGALWIGTENGLYRHDGESIRNPIGDARLQVYNMAFGSDGTLWIASDGGIYRYHDGKIAQVPVSDPTWSPLQGQALAPLAHGDILVVGKEGKLWRVSAAGESARMESALPATLESQQSEALEVRSILVGNDGAWWFGCGSALCRWHENRLERWGAADGVPHSEWLGLRQTKDGAIWARSDRYVIRRAAGDTQFADITPQGLGRGSNHFWLPMVEDSKGRLLTPGNAGVYRWQAGQWRYFGERNGLVEDGVRAMLTDLNGDVWLGTTGHGLAHWRGYENWSSWTTRQGLPSDVVWSVADDGAGRMWIGTQRGVVSTGGDGQEMANEAPSVTDQVGGVVADGSGGMWLSTFGGELFHRRRGQTWRSMTDGGRIRGGRLLAADGELWIVAGNRGLFSLPLDGSAPGRRRDELDQLLSASDRSVNTACREQNSDVIWVGTGSGLLRYDPAHGFSRPQVNGLTPSDGVAYLACGAGRVWLRTGSGRQLMRIDLHQSGILRAVPVRPAVLKGLRILSLLEDHRGWLWAGTDVGVVWWNGKNWRRFDESNGLVWNDCDQNALAEDTEGAIWVGTSGGVSRITFPEQLARIQPLVLKLDEARLGSVDLMPGHKIEVPGPAQMLELRWEIPRFTNRLSQHVRYRLRGSEDGWTDLTGSELRYAGLGSGSYRLELFAVNDDLGQSSQPLTLAFDIAPPWWRRPTVVTAALVLAALLIYVGHRFRIRRLVQHRNALEALVRERTRELAESHERMRELAFTDSLTGAMSRRAILSAAERELAQQRRHGGALTLALLDLDHFKSVNDTYGHPAGDALLRGLVTRLRTQIRDSDCIGRYGGEEFLLVLPDLSVDEPGGVERVDSWRQAVAGHPFDIGGATPLGVTCSIGVASISADETLESLIGRVDAALYRAKAAGRNRVEVWRC
ncbi:MAG: diguanylate cyclase [Massilia sp.]|nr:diguanylate cyclase [Massilia sp.]